MKRCSLRLGLVLAALLAFPMTCPAPFIYRPGEGWVYEAPGEEGAWMRTKAEDQLEVAEEAYAQKQYSLALKAGRRLIKVWPVSDYAARAQYLIARSYEARGNDQKAFKEFQALLERHPKVDNYREVLERQFAIANRYLAGKWFRLWGVIPFFPSMQKTVEMYEKIIKNGPYSPVAPLAQLNIGAAREKQASFFNRIDPFRAAVEAYVTAADRYFDNREIASEAIYKAGYAYYRQARKADYDQTAAGHAIDMFTDLITLYPNDPRVEGAQAKIAELRMEQARGNFAIARFYEKGKKWNGALIYYNEVTIAARNSPIAEKARRRIEAIRNRHAP